MTCDPEGCMGECGKSFEPMVHKGEYTINGNSMTLLEPVTPKSEYGCSGKKQEGRIRGKKTAEEMFTCDHSIAMWHCIRNCSRNTEKFKRRSLK